jgi:transglutaminase superfamily protein
VKLRGVPLSALGEALVRLLLVRRGDTRERVAGLLESTGGRESMTRDEQALAIGTDGALRRLGVRCLWRSIVIAEMLRRRGVDARLRLSVSAARPSVAHAEVEIDGHSLRPEPPGSIVLQ